MTTSKSIRPILAKQLASCVVTPMLQFDDQNALIHYNEPALGPSAFP